MHRPTTRTALQRGSMKPTFLLSLFCGNGLHPVDFQNLAGKVPSTRESYRHPVGMRDRPDIRSKRLGIPFCDMTQEDIAPSTLTKHKPVPPHLAPGAPLCA
jgi:hypothetical protein